MNWDYIDHTAAALAWRTMRVWDVRLICDCTAMFVDGLLFGSPAPYYSLASPPTLLIGPESIPSLVREKTTHSADVLYASETADGSRHLMAAHLEAATSVLASCRLARC